MFEWFINFFGIGPLYVDLARVQYEERTERRAALDRKLSGRDAQQCLARVRRRMTEGDSAWLPPMYGRAEALAAWKRRHPSRRRRGSVVVNINSQRSK